jgi:hypothetical protein
MPPLAASKSGVRNEHQAHLIKFFSISELRVAETVMIRFRLKELIADREFRERRVWQRPLGSTA